MLDRLYSINCTILSLQKQESHYRGTEIPSHILRQEINEIINYNKSYSRKSCKIKKIDPYPLKINIMFLNMTTMESKTRDSLFKVSDICMLLYTLYRVTKNKCMNVFPGH